MRIIAGNLRGRRFLAPPGKETRPTPNRVREALFSILGNIDGFYVWDAFAGSGALGLEALSRGAHHVLFTDTSRAALATLRHNVASLDLSPYVDIQRTSFFHALPKLVEPPDLLFFDPPYAANLYPQILDAVASCDRIPSDAQLVLETPADLPISPPDSFTDLDQRRYGSTSLIFLRKL